MEQDAAELASEALDWLLGMAQERGTALAWTGRPDDDELDPTLYSGTAGIVLALLDGYRHFGDDKYARAAVRGAQTIAEAAGQDWDGPDGRWGTPASSANCCATHASATAATRPTQWPGPTIRPFHDPGQLLSL
jgi:hypothetical protein